MKSRARNIILIAGLILVLLLSVGTLSAHQPRLDTETYVSIENPIIVDTPEISQAFYGNLKGKSVYYQINSDKQFQLYLNLLVPTSPGQGGEFISAEVTDESGKVVMFLNGTNSTWTPYFEEFGGDYYLKGPEATLEVPAGTYNIKIFNSQNQGKYSLAVGKTESFPINEAITTIFTLPLLKEQFFAKPITTLFLEFMGIILALGSLIVIFTFMVKSRMSEEMVEITRNTFKVIKPVLWYGTIISAVVWALVMYNDPRNILGLVNSLVLVIIIIMTWLVGSKISKAISGNIPIIYSILLIIFWAIFAFLAISVI